MLGIEGKCAVVTGAASGIGRATALRLASDGAVVGAVDRDEHGLRALSVDALSSSGTLVPLVADVSDEAQIEEVFDSFASLAQGLDILVANAGVMPLDDARADELETPIWKHVIDINLTGIFLTCKHGIRHMLASGGGVVICTGSPTGSFGIAAGFDAYSASKGGVYALARVMARDYATHQIRVNAVLPGAIDTPLARELENETTAIPLGRRGSVDEVASVIAFLASDEASYVTGAAVYVDGGLTA